MSTRSEDKVSWRFSLGIWSIPIVLSAGASYSYSRDVEHPVSIARALWLGVGSWLIWALMTPLVVRLGQRWPLDRRRHWRLVLNHCVAAVGIGIVTTAVTAVASYTFHGDRSLAAQVGSRIVQRAPMDSFIYCVIVVVSYLAINTRRLHERELFAERVSRELSEAQLGALRMQLQPHFLFNSLNAVMALVRDHDVSRADQALTLLSDVLRSTLRQGAEPRVRLQDEVTFIRNYLEIETLRFGDRLRVRYCVPDELANAQVPTFILQPLVENALQHGIMRLPNGGAILISAEKRNAKLHLCVTDDGVGLLPDWETRLQRGVGISNSRARIAHIYGTDGTLTITPRADNTGTRASIELPFENRP